MCKNVNYYYLIKNLLRMSMKIISSKNLTLNLNTKRKIKLLVGDKIPFHPLILFILIFNTSS